MEHEEWKNCRCPYGCIPCEICIKKDCLDDPEYESDID